MLKADRPGHGVGFLALGHAMLVVPEFLRGRAFFEEKKIGADGGVGFEDAVGQAHDGVQVALLKQMLFQPGLDAFAKQRAIGQYHGSTATGFEQAHDEGKKEVCGLSGLKVLGKVALNAVLFAAAEGRIGEHNIHPVALGIADIGPGKGVIMAHKRGIVNAVEQHIGNTEHVRELFLLCCAQGLLHLLLIFGLLHIALAHVPDGAGEKAAGAAGRVKRISPGLGSMRFAMKAVTARGV